MSIESLTSELWLKVDQLHMDYLLSNDNYDKLHIRKKLEELVADYLSIVPQDRKFVSVATVDIISNSAKWKPDFSLDKATQAFRAIEQHAVNLINKPWRKNLWSIRQYSGFYKQSVETVLVGVEKMFKDMGYSPSHSKAQVLSLAQPRVVGEHLVNIDMVTSVARDCLLAIVECQILAEVHNKVSAQFSTVLEEVIDFRRDHIGSTEMCIIELSNSKQVEAIRAKEILNIKKKLQGSKDSLSKFLKKTIQMKKSELKCPVCLEEAGVPIYRCVNEHLIFSSCRNRVGLTCPVCRVRYQGLPERYRYAERTVEEIQRLREQLAEIE